MPIDRKMMQFIKENLDLLTSNSKNQINDLKRKKNEFWRKIKNVSIPKNQAVANSTINYLIKTKIINNQDDLDELIEISDYLKKFLTIKDLELLLTEIYTEGKHEISKSFLTKQDYKAIKSDEYHQKQISEEIFIEEKACEITTTFREKIELLRKYGYDILINRFEPLLREILINEVLIINYGLKDWTKQIPKGVIEALEEEKEIDINKINIEDFFEETFFWCLKEIAVFSDHYKHMNSLTGDLSKIKFNEIMDEMNELRKKIAHAKSSFSAIDLNDLIYNIRFLCQGEIGKDLIDYIDREKYRLAEEIPSTFFDEYECPNNLPSEDYDLVGGFIGRKNEINHVIRFLYSEQDRIVSITGAGGIGKTAVALKITYRILADRKNPYEAILWFTAKEEMLTENGIVPIESKIKSSEHLVKEILNIIDSKQLENIESVKFSYDNYDEHIYKVLSSRKCLLIIDNLETIKDEEIIEFIKDIPRPSQVLITSRKGLGEIERRYELPDFAVNDAMKLFRVVSKERNRKDLLKLGNDAIKSLVQSVKCYPLLIKWAIGRVCIGREIYKAFSEIYSGKSDIARFAFNDIFSNLMQESKSCLYSMIVFGDKPITRHFLKHLADLDSDKFDDAIRELIIVSFVYNENVKAERSINTLYHMLSLTRGYVRYQLDRNKKEFNSIQSRYYDLSKQIEEYEKSQKIYRQTLESIGITTDDDKIAFNYVKSAKEYLKFEELEKVEDNFKEALEISPNFPYALNEYAKFKSSQGYMHDFNDLFKRSINADPENWHTYFHYGISLKKQNRLSDAIDVLKKAKKLNPTFIGIINTLARVHTWRGEFEIADELFNEVNKNEIYIKSKTKLITIKNHADNYKRWAEYYFQRDDLEGGLEKLNKGLYVLEAEKENIILDLPILRLEKRICLNIAINLYKNDKFDEALPFFKRAYKKLRLRSGIIVSSDKERSIAYYYVAKYGFESGKLTKEEINKYIKKGIAISQKTGIQKFKNLAMRVSKKPTISEGEKKYGYIKYFNFQKKYGIIWSEGDTFIFFKADFYNYIDDQTLLRMKGKEVSFLLREDPQKSGRKIATLITFESD